MATRTYLKTAFGAWPPGILKLKQEIEDNATVTVGLIPSQTSITNLNVGVEELTVTFDGTPSAPMDTEMTTVIIPGHMGGDPLESPTKFESLYESQTTNNNYQPKIDTSVSPEVDPRLDPGTYRVNWSVDYAGTSVGAVVSLEAQADGSQVGELAGVVIDTENNWLTWAGECDLVIASPSYVNFALNYKRVGGAGAAIVQNAQMAYTPI